jgi:LDH2 family malate/lactate/ureidoglycolate dehydrogenase
MIGMSFTNTSPFMVPTRAKARTLGTNPLSLAAPAEHGDQFVLDMATTSVAVGKLEIASRKGERIPKGWAVDAEGHETTDPSAGVAGGVMPLGGAEETSGYKGYGLGMLVEIFCGILADGAWGPNVRNWMTTDVDADLVRILVVLLLY